MDLDFTVGAQEAEDEVRRPRRRQAWEIANERRTGRMRARQKRDNPPEPFSKECHYCGTHAKPGDPLTKDHIVPRSRLGRGRNGYIPGIINTVPACYRCNQIKGSNRSTCTCYTCRTAWAVYGPMNYRGQLVAILIVDVRGIAAEQDKKKAS